MRLLITGPPASGKTHVALDLFHAHAGVQLIVPTATMAEHLRHQFARRGLAVRPQAVGTLAHFLDAWSPLAEAPAGLVQFLLKRALDRQQPERFRESSEFPGFVRSLAALFAEAPAEALPADVRRLFGTVSAELAARGMAPRHARISAAAERIGAGGLRLPTRIVFDGFFRFSPQEIALLIALSGQTEVAVTAPEPVAELLEAGFEEHACGRPRRAPARTAFRAANLERECEEIARRILTYAAAGRNFRDIGIVLRAREPYAPLLETTLARCGIPARFYFSDPLACHPAIAYLGALVRAHLADWDHELLLAALRMPASGLGATPAGDEFDFALRKLLPGRGLPVEGLSFPWPDVNWRDHLEPASWAARLKQLRGLVPRPDVIDHATREQVYVWRSTAAALAVFDEALDGAAAALEGAGRMNLVPFWKQMETELATRALRVPDARRNVVRVMDAYEARQWELPIVFVCGLVDHVFPQHHNEDPIIGDLARRRAGLETAEDRERGERFLFHLAASRATVETVFSYPADSGAACVFPIPEAIDVAPIPLIITPDTVGPEAVRPRTFRPPELTSLSASSIESYLQCPFKFLAGHLLRLRERPPAPRDRLDARLQGTILHNALAALARKPARGADLLDQAFEEQCAKARVPAGYRTEAVRLELRRHFLDFLSDPKAALTAPDVRVEEKFAFVLNRVVTINGRIDRIDIDAAGRALIIDYKYSAANQITRRIEASADGGNVQGGLYLLGAERALGLKPRGMIFCGVKNGVTWQGWENPADLAPLMRAAEEKAQEVYEAACGGHFPVRPADAGKCAWCDYRDICRVESQEQPRAQEAGGI